MRVPKLSCLFIMIVATMSVQFAGAQELTAESRNAAIRNIAQHIAANYVYPEKGGQIASHIQAANFKGQFDKAASWQELDEMVTKELKAFSKDGHLFVRHDAEVVKELKNPKPEKERNNMNEQGGVSKSTIEESKVLENNIGYIKITGISINKANLDDLDSHIIKMKDTKALIIDLRDNGGGGSEIGPVLESYFLPAGVPTLRFTKRDGNYTTDSTVAWVTERYEKPLYLIVNKGTASAAEAFAYVLQQSGRAKIVGERTAGAAYMNSWYAINDENFVAVSTAAPSIPGKNISWEQSGIQPDIRVKKEDPLAVSIREASRS